MLRPDHQDVDQRGSWATGKVMSYFAKGVKHFSKEGVSISTKGSEGLK